MDNLELILVGYVGLILMGFMRDDTARVVMFLVCISISIWVIVGVVSRISPLHLAM